MTKDVLLSLQLPHWLMLAGASLVIIGCIGLAIRRKNSTESAIDPEQSPEPHSKMPPLPTLLKSRPKTTGKPRDQ
ncbi:hypothetical protein [Bradyrhizobium sp. RD5-C2]|uniref:hypothetical protein n=1 Tax=Bradyrhizobium sp. RD5-C2 TaxID=244562 RepID=UPI001CC62BE2|nr:hypothetical protein [Bradyrhizobium sp. RD5-C2]